MLLDGIVIVLVVVEVVVDGCGVLVVEYGGHFNIVSAIENIMAVLC